MKKISLGKFKELQVVVDAISKIRGGSGGSSCGDYVTYTYQGNTASSGCDHETTHADCD